VVWWVVEPTDVDALRWTHTGAQLATNALLHTVFITVEHVASVLTRLFRLLLFWVLEGDSRSSQVLNGQFKSAEEREIFAEIG
jgi:hypothetical protein